MDDTLARENSGDEDDAALKYAIALSLQTRSPEHNDSASSENVTINSKVQGTSAHRPKPAGIVLGSIILDRRKMEEERLARVNKRKASDSDSVNLPLQRKPKLTSSTPTIQGTPGSSNDVPRTPGTSPIPFLCGTVKKTWAFRHERTDDDIKIEEVLQKEKLELAVISSFQWDDDWILSKLDMSKTRIICVAYAADEAHVTMFPSPPSPFFSSRRHKPFPS
jgi:hypothetical protein